MPPPCTGGQCRILSRQLKEVAEFSRENSVFFCEPADLLHRTEHVYIQNGAWVIVVFNFNFNLFFNFPTWGKEKIWSISQDLESEESTSGLENQLSTGS